MCFDKLLLTKFYLCGHSLGGYICSLFTMKYQYYIEKLILLSPVGLSSNYKEIISTRLEDFLQMISFKFQKMPTSFLKAFGAILPNYIFYYICDQSKFRGLKIKVRFQYIKIIIIFILFSRKNLKLIGTLFMFFFEINQDQKKLSFSFLIKVYKLSNLLLIIMNF